jgi:hypothetical protein
MADRLSGPETPASPFYVQILVDWLGARTLAALADDPGLRAVAASALRAVAGRWTARRRLSGRFGTTLETALTARIAAWAGGIEDPGPVLRALIDAQAPDGGWPAERMHRRLADREAAWYGSRAFATAAALRAIDLLEAVCAEPAAS